MSILGCRHLIKLSIRHGSRNIEGQNNEYLFGNKRVEIGTQIVRFSITLPYFVRKELFGLNYEKVTEDIIQRTGCH